MVVVFFVSRSGPYSDSDEPRGKSQQRAISPGGVGRGNVGTAASRAGPELGLEGGSAEKASCRPVLHTMNQ